MCMRLFFIILSIISLNASYHFAPLVVKAKKEKPAPTWQFIELQTTERVTIPGFEEQQLKNIPGVTTTTAGNPGQLTTISIQGAASKYTKIMWNGMSFNDAEADAALIPFSSGKIEVIKGIHCAEYGNGAIGGVVNVIPFTMPKNQNGGVRITAGNYDQGLHLWWQQNTEGFSLQQHLETGRYIGINSISKRYQEKYPTTLRPQTSKQYFLNQFCFENHHVKTAAQVGLVRLSSTASDIFFTAPYDSRAKNTMQIYSLESTSKSELVKPYLKILNNQINRQNFSPYQSHNDNKSNSDDTKARLGIGIKKNIFTFEPVVEYHDSIYANSFATPRVKKGYQYAFAQGVHLHKDNFKMKNWARQNESYKLIG